MSGAVDLSPEAIAARRQAVEAGAGHGGLTARQLIGRASRLIDAAHRHARAAEKKGWWTHKGRAHVRQAQDAIVTAAVQLEIAQGVPLDTGHLHALTQRTIAACRKRVNDRLPVDRDDRQAWAVFATYVNQTGAEQRTRSTQER